MAAHAFGYALHESNIWSIICNAAINTILLAPNVAFATSVILQQQCHPMCRARLNVCIDERSLGFWALGYGRAAARPAAVITSSGTAVANLLPAVVEASLSGVPLLLLTADRPADMRDTGGRLLLSPSGDLQNTGLAACFSIGG